MLPYELLGIVFTYLPQRDLDTVQLVCKSWREIASDKIWRDQFNDHFGTIDVCPVTPYFTRWRRELIVRKEVLQKWKRCAKVTDFTINSSLTDNTDLFCNFATEMARATCFNAHKGAGVIIELDKGKIKRRLYASTFAREVLPVTTADGSRFGLINAFLDGSATTIVYSRDDTVAQHKDLPYKHETAISAVWIAKSRNFSKQTGRSTGIATGSFDGTIILNSTQGFQQFQPERSPVVMLEGTMYGSYAANDGDSVVALYGSGSVYRFSCSGETIETTKVAQLPFTRTTMGSTYQLHMCNNYVVVQTFKSIYVIDLTTQVSTTLTIPSGAEVTAFSMDKSYTPGAKYMVAGLSTNELCAWSLPGIEFKEFSYEGPKITISKRSGKANTPVGDDEGTEAESERAQTESNVVKARESTSAGTGDDEERSVNTKPQWIRYNPIGYERQLEQSEKPQITKVALNAAVVLIAGYNGMVMAMDVLSGRPLKRVNSRISKNVLDLTRYSRDGFVPVTQLEIDPNPLRLRGVISVRPAIQFFDLGTVGVSRNPAMNGKRGSKSRQRSGGNPASKTTRYDLEEVIQLHDEFEEITAEQEQHDAMLAEDFSLQGMGEEEQLAYAMMLSEQHERDASSSAGTDNFSAEIDDDESLRLALELSSAEDPSTTAPPGPLEAEDTDDEDLRRAIALSLNSS